MAALFFPNLDSLRQVLAGGILPPTLTRAPARARLDDFGPLWIEPHSVPTREALAALARFGVALHGSAGTLTQPLRSWAELLPLRRISIATSPSIVLFEVADHKLASFAAALRRQRCEPGNVHLLEPRRALVLVRQPPAGLLLRVADAGDVIEAFAEQLPGVWAPFGWEHPLAEHLVVLREQVLVLRPPRSIAAHPAAAAEWTAGDFDLRRVAAASCEPAVPQSVAVRFALRRTTADTPRETVWVFPGVAAERFWEFCATANERLLRQFEVATVGIGEDTRVVVRPATGLRIPPLLPLPADGYYADPRVAGLYIPTRRVLHPAIRPRELNRLFGLGTDRLTWIENGIVMPRSVATSSFRPVPALLEYTSPAAVELNVEPGRAAPFEFERFAFAVPREDQPARRHEEEPVHRPRSIPLPRRPAVEKRPGWFARSLERLLGSTRRKQSEPVELPAAEGKDDPRRGVGSRPRDRVEQKLASPDALVHGPDRTARRLDLESRVLDVFPKLGPRERSAGWAELAALYGATGNPSDAAVCWINAAWEIDSPPAAWLEQWLVAECRAAKQSAPIPSLDRWLGEPGRPGAARIVAAYAVWGARQGQPPPDLLAALPRVIGFLERQFDDLPARAAWLARLAVTGLCGGDALGLARWRDRVLARLRDKGPGLDLDEPSFLRFHGTASPDRYRTAREWLVRAHKPILDWVGRLGTAGRLQWAGLDAETDATAAYARFMLAWGLGCLGEPTRSREWAAQAKKLLGRPPGPGLDPGVHALLADAFGLRIRDMQEGRPAKPGLPADLAARFESLSTFSRYAVDRLRDHSRILEPTGRTQAFRGLDLRGFRGADLLGERLQLVADGSDPAHLADEARHLLELCSATPSSAVAPRVVLTLLDLAPHLDAGLVAKVLYEVVPAASWLESWLAAGRWTEAERADRLPRYLGRLVGGAFAAAASFNQYPAARPLVEFLLARAPGDHALRSALTRTAGSLFRSLRKLGYRTEAESLLRVLDPGRGEWPGEGVFPAARLGLAVGWFAAGDEEAGNRILDEAQRRLFVTRVGDDRDRTELAIAYAEALGFAPPRIALGRLEEIFQRLDRVTITGSTNRYFTLKPLQLIDGVVRSVVTEDFALGPAVRGWLDDDEFLIRRRVHRDMAVVLREVGIG